jgi:hypothetical protein
VAEPTEKELEEIMPPQARSLVSRDDEVMVRQISSE